MRGASGTMLSRGALSLGGTESAVGEATEAVDGVLRKIRVGLSAA